MGLTPQYTSLGNFPGSSLYSVVAPFGADIDTTSRGSVKYTEFTTSDSFQMNTVSSFIQSETGHSFYGTRMMVAEWNGVPEYQGSVVSSDDLYSIYILYNVSTSVSIANGSLGVMEGGENVQYYHNNLLSQLFGY